MEDKRKDGDSKKRVSVISILLRTLFTVVLLCVLLILGRLTYCNKVLLIVLALVHCFVQVYLYWSKRYKTKGRKLAVGLGVVVFLMPILFADGFLVGEKVPTNYMLMRGMTRLMYSEPLKSTDEVINSTLPPSNFNEMGVRDSNFECPEGYTYTQYTITDNYGGTVSLEELKPENANGKAVLMVHGGAYIGGMTNTFNDYLVWYSQYAKGATVYSVDYKLAPDYTYKEIINDVVCAYNMILAEGYQPSDIVMSGDSAGGGLVLAVCLYMRDELNYSVDQMPCAVTTISAWTDLTMTADSYKVNRYKDAQFGGNNVLKTAADIYASTDSTVDKDTFLHNIYVSPYFCDDFSGLPKVYMQVGTYEMLLNDTLDIVDKAVSQGADFKVDTYPGMFHEFQMLKGRVSTADQAWDALGAFMCSALGID